MTNIHPTVITYPNVQIGKGTSVDPFAILGKPYRLVNGKTLRSNRITHVGKRCQIGSYSIIGKGSSIDDDCIIDNGTEIEQCVKIGKKCVLIYRAQICNYSSIGNRCIIGGFIGERSKIESDCRIFGKLIHPQTDPSKGWDDADDEPFPTIKRGAFIGFNALIIGGITIGSGAYVCAGAIVTKNIPPKHIVYGTNKSISYKSGKGKLSQSPFFRKSWGV